MNLSMNQEQRREMRQERKINVMAVVMDRKAMHAQSKFTALANPVTASRPGEMASHGIMLPMRNLKLTQG